MELADRVYFKVLRWQNVWRRQLRYLFPSPAELRLIELMGGHVLRLKFIKRPSNGFCFAIVLNMGKLFNMERVKREVGYGRYWVDFANDLNRIIEVDGNPYHMDVVADFDREVAIKELCARGKFEARFLRIRADELYRNPNDTQRKVLAFLIG